MMSCAGDASSLCEQINQYIIKCVIDHSGGWKFYDSSGLYDMVENQHAGPNRCDIYWHNKEGVTKHIFYSKRNKLTHLVRDDKTNQLFVIDRTTNKIIRLDLNDAKFEAKDVSHYSVLAWIRNAWQLCINNKNNLNSRIIVCISTIRVRPQTITYMIDDEISWQETFNERILQACILNTLDLVCINENFIMKICSKTKRRLEMIRSGYGKFQQANGICSITNGGFLVSDEYNRRIYSFNNNLQMMQILFLEFRPTDLFFSNADGLLFVAKGKRKPYSSFVFHLPIEKK